MQILKSVTKKCTGYVVAAVFLFFCVFLTGCTGREELFSEEIQMVEVSEEMQQETEKEMTAKETGEEEHALTKPAEIYVDVCGAVVSPGVFRLDEGSRVFQAIEAAGGYLPEAAAEHINKAGILTDGQQIYVPSVEEVKKSAQEKQDLTFLPGENLESGKKVNLNTAGAEELTTLTGIGASRAKDIISYRETNGPFAVIEDIMKVQGIKKGTFEKIKDEIIVG